MEKTVIEHSIENFGLQKTRICSSIEFWVVFQVNFSLFREIHEFLRFFENFFLMNRFTSVLSQEGRSLVVSLGSSLGHFVIFDSYDPDSS